MKVIQFKGAMKIKRFEKNDFRIYVLDVNQKAYPEVKSNNRGEVVIAGDIPDLIPNNIYTISGIEEYNNSFGWQYSLKHIEMDKPTDVESSRRFLYEVITEKQTDTLLEVYPNIIDMIINNEPVDLSKTKGIKSKTFEIISQKVVENFCLKELITLFDGALTLAQVRKIYEKYTSVEGFIEAINTKPYSCLCSLSRVGFKTADSILLNMEKIARKGKGDSRIKFEDKDLITSKQRMRACLEFILTENEANGNTRMLISDLRKECYELTPECIGHFLECVQEDNSNIYVDNENKSIGTSYSYNAERYIYNAVNELLSNKDVWSVNTEAYRIAGGDPLTDEQMQLLENVRKYGISILTAPAGSGKSYSVNNLIYMLKDMKKSFLLCTPTGKSADVVSGYTGEDAGTIHRKLGYNPSEDNPWHYGEDNKLPHDVVIVDEWSMADVFLAKQLFEAIDTSKTKVVLVFDADQLSSVSCGNVAHDMNTSGVIPTALLTKIFRYGEGGLMKVATQVRRGERFLDKDFKGGVEIFGKNKDFIYNELYQEKMPIAALKIYNKILESGYDLEDISILTSQNVGDYGTTKINQMVQSMLQRRKSTPYIKYGNKKFHLGDKVMQIVNNYKASNIYGDEEEEVFNGNTGIISSVSNRIVVVDYKDKQILYKKSDLDQLELGYCTTIHKAQGSSVKQVIVLIPKAHTYMLTSNLIYVGITRARERVFMLGNHKTVNRAIKKKDNLRRDTWLETMFESLS